VNELVSIKISQYLKYNNSYILINSHFTTSAFGSTCIVIFKSQTALLFITLLRSSVTDEELKFFPAILPLSLKVLKGCILLLNNEILELLPNLSFNGPVEHSHSLCLFNFLFPQRITS
jgi:hypothetical protein